MNNERLLYLRESKDLTQDELGKIIDASKQSISKWENGKETIPLYKLNAYSNYFNVNLDYIIGLSNDKNKTKNIELNKNVIGNNIKILRENYNLTQRDLAKFLNTTHSAICAYENGKTLIQTSFAYQLCMKYNISLDWLCGK